MLVVSGRGGTASMPSLAGIFAQVCRVVRRERNGRVVAWAMLVLPACCVFLASSGFLTAATMPFPAATRRAVEPAAVVTDEPSNVASSVEVPTLDPTSIEACTDAIGRPGSPGCTDDPAAVCPPGWTAFAQALYWTVREGGADNWAQEITPMGQFGSTIGSAALVDAPFDWNAGYRVGLTTHKPDDVDVSLYYTNFRTGASASAAGEVYSAFLANFFVGNPDGAAFGPHYRRAEMDWDFAFHTIDLEIGRTFAVSPSFSLRPFVGLKAAVIDQTMRSTWNSPIDTSSTTYLFDSAVETLTHDYWGLGPSVGVNAEIPLYRGTRNTVGLYAAPSAALMYGHWSFSDRYQNDGPTTTTIPTPTAVAIDTDPIDGASVMGRGTLGFAWTRTFARSSMTVRCGYEAQVWMNQMQFYSFNMGRLNNLTSLQGGVLEFGWNF
ncbi:MAG: Lpg1974 family pore-forming outer membrane protein [Pirellulales bacterium]